MADQANEKRGSLRPLKVLNYPGIGEVRIRELAFTREVVQCCERFTPSSIYRLLELGLTPEHDDDDIDRIMEAGLVLLDPKTDEDKIRRKEVFEALGVDVAAFGGDE